MIEQHLSLRVINSKALFYLVKRNFQHAQCPRRYHWPRLNFHVLATLFFPDDLMFLEAIMVAYEQAIKFYDMDAVPALVPPCHCSKLEPKIIFNILTVFLGTKNWVLG